LGFDPAGEVSYLVEQGTTLGHELTDFSIGVHHRRVVSPTEGLPDFRQGQVGELST